MKKLTVLVTVLAVSTVALGAAAQLKEQYRAQYEKTRYLGLQYVLPGGYALVTRLGLSEEQQKLLGEIHKEYMSEYYKVQRTIHAKLPKMGPGDYRDPAKYAAWNHKRRELMRQQKLAPPVEKVGNVLTPEQLGKVLKAHAQYEAWVQWLVTHLAEADGKLNEVAGPEAKELDEETRRLFTSLAALLARPSLLARLGLTAEQRAKLKTLADDYLVRSRGVGAMVYPSLRSDKLSPEQLAAARGVLQAEAYKCLREQFRGQALAVLTAQQKDKLDRATQVIEAGNTEIVRRYLAYVKEVDSVLPPSKQKAGAHYPHYYHPGQYHPGQRPGAGRVEKK